MSAITPVTVAPGVTLNYESEDAAREVALAVIAALKYERAEADVIERDALIRAGIAAMVKLEDTDGIAQVFDAIDWSQWAEADVLKLIEVVINHSRTIDHAHPDCLDAVAKVCSITMAGEDMQSAEVRS